MSVKVYPLAKAQWDSSNGCGALIEHWETSQGKAEAEALVGALMASHVPDAKAVFDLGCGSGRYAPVCIEYLPKLRKYVGYDTSKALLEAANKAHGGQSVVKFTEADIFHGAPYIARWRPDILLSIDTSRHYKDPLGLLDVIVDKWPAKHYLFSVLYGKPMELMNGRVVSAEDMETRLAAMGRIIAKQDVNIGDGLNVRYAIIEGE